MNCERQGDLRLLNEIQNQPDEPEWVSCNLSPNI